MPAIDGLQLQKRTRLGQRTSILPENLPFASHPSYSEGLAAPYRNDRDTTRRERGTITKSYAKSGTTRLIAAKHGRTPVPARDAMEKVAETAGHGPHLGPTNRPGPANQQLGSSQVHVVQKPQSSSERSARHELLNSNSHNKAIKLDMSIDEMTLRKDHNLRDTDENMLYRFVEYINETNASPSSEKWEIYLELHDAFHPLYQAMQNDDWAPSSRPLLANYKQNRREWQATLRHRFQNHPMWMLEQYEQLKHMKRVYDRPPSSRFRSRGNDPTDLEELVRTAKEDDYFENLCHALHKNGAASTGIAFGVPKQKDPRAVSKFTEEEERIEHSELVEFARDKFGSMWQKALPRPTSYDGEHSHETLWKPLRCQNCVNFNMLSIDQFLERVGINSDMNDSALAVSKVYTKFQTAQDTHAELEDLANKAHVPPGDKIELQPWLIQWQANPRFGPQCGLTHARRMSYFKPLYDMLFFHWAKHHDYVLRAWPMEARFRLRRDFGHHWAESTARSAPGAGLELASASGSEPGPRHAIVSGSSAGTSNAAGQPSKSAGPGKRKGKAQR